MSARRSPKRGSEAGPVLPLFNRELSWLAFNRRVLAEAASPEVPLLERVKFLSIASSNLDEFLMVRTGGLRALIASGVPQRSADGLTPRQQLRAVRTQTAALLGEMYRELDILQPLLRKQRLRIDRGAFTKKQQAALSETFRLTVGPVLTPLAYDPGHPLPFLASGALNLAVLLQAGSEQYTAFLKVPRQLPRFIAVPGSSRRVVPVEDLIAMNIREFFPGLDVREVVPFRVIRNADIALREDEVEDLLASVESEVRMRERKEIVRMEIADRASSDAQRMLRTAFAVPREDVFLAPALLKLGDLIQIEANDGAHLRDEAFSPRMPAELVNREDIFSILRARDILLHRPYDSYAAVLELIQSAADDPDVVSIRQTLYRTEPGSLIVDSLARAAASGKQVTVIVEVQARFDEERNIAWARQLEEAGVQVVYGLVGLKTHSKIALIIRREGAELQRYVHLSTGNYNARTARTYTDIDLLTSDPAIGEDVTQLLNLITGYSAASARDVLGDRGALSWKRLVIAPSDYHGWVIEKIAREARNAADGKPAHIIAKLNAIVDPNVIEALYRAADAGVRIDLIVRGICCLMPRPNIRVTSIVDRFLEHSRIVLFRNGGDTEIYLTSGDWMPRNFFRRIEVTWPVQSSSLRDRIEQQILGLHLADDAKSWRLLEDGAYRRRKQGQRPVRSQQRFIEISRAESSRLAPHEERTLDAAAMRRKTGKRKS